MTQKDYLKHIESVFTEALQITQKKNSDYANAEDAFFNFRNSTLAKVSMERGVLVRIMDKLSRISNLIDRPPQVKDESIRDAIRDAIVYLGILDCMLFELKE
jgi:Holliday junction resolvasome RuvABC endonuclease subunit